MGSIATIPLPHRSMPPSRVSRAVKWNLPLSVFRKAYEERLEVFMAQIAAELGALEENEEVLEAWPEDVLQFLGGKQRGRMGVGRVGEIGAKRREWLTG